MCIASTRKAALALLAIALSYGGSSSARASLLVTSNNPDQVLRYDDSGAPLGGFASGGGLSGAVGVTVGPDGDIFVTGNLNRSVLRYDGATGAFLGTFGSGLTNPGQLKFGPDGNLYVSNRSSIARFDGLTGTLLPAITGGGLNTALALTFGPNGDLFVASQNPGTVKRYDPKTGTFLGDFVTGGSGGLLGALEMTFGADGDLYVVSQGTNSVKRYNGANGTFLGDFIASGSGGLNRPVGMAFGPDGNLYLSSQGPGGTEGILRYDGTSGAFLDVFATGGGLDTPNFLVFTSTAVPEPSSLVLLGTGAVGVAACGLRRAARSKATAA